jgi:hypothetical protein
VCYRGLRTPTDLAPRPLLAAVAEWRSLTVEAPWAMRTQIQGLDTCLKLTKLNLSDNELTDLKVILLQG